MKRAWHLARRSVVRPKWLMARIKFELRTPTRPVTRAFSSRRSMRRTNMPTPSKARRVLAAFVVSPTTAGFDFCHFIAGAQFFAHERGFRSFDLLLLKEDPLISQAEMDWDSQDSDLLAWRFHNLITPLAFLASSVGDVSIRSVTDDWSSELTDSCVFPVGLSRGFIPEWSTPSAFAWRSSSGFSCFRATDSAISLVQSWLKANRIGDPFVVINLRDRVKDVSRNSNLAEWLKFAQFLEQAGYAVVVVPDTGHMWFTTTEESPWPIFREASLNVDLRLALYELAYCSFFYSNGPAALAMLDSSVDFVAVLPLIEDATYAQATTYRDLGLEPGSDSFNWVVGVGVFHWSVDDFDELVTAFGKFEKRKAQIEGTQTKKA